jgi:hypothetical protein
MISALLGRDFSTVLAGPPSKDLRNQSDTVRLKNQIKPVNIANPNIISMTPPLENSESFADLGLVMQTRCH